MVFNIKEYRKKPEVKLKHKKRSKKNRKEHPEKGIKYTQEYRKIHPERENAQKRARKLKGNICKLCGNKKDIDFHHINYKKDEGFTVCGSCHKSYCKEGRSFEDSLRLYKEGIEGS